MSSDGGDNAEPFQWNGDSPATQEEEREGRAAYGEEDRAHIPVWLREKDQGLFSQLSPTRLPPVVGM